jgi:hypothetical protein
MAKFTLIERELPDDSTFIPPDPPAPAQPLNRNPGEQLFIINRLLVDRRGRQRGTFVLHGTIVQVFSQPPSLDFLMSFQASNRLRGKGVINTQGVVRTGDFPNGVTFAIVGGTGEFKRAQGTVTVQRVDPGQNLPPFTEFTYRVS